MGRLLPVDCEHGETLDWGDFGSEWSPFDGLCVICVPKSVRVARTEEYRLANRHWLEEFYPDYYKRIDSGCT
jgi:hypothetical protein